MDRQDMNNFIKMEEKIKEYIKQFSKSLIPGYNPNICCSEEERTRLLSLIPVIKVVGEHHDTNVACAIILVLYYGMNLTETGYEYNTDILLSILLNFITIKNAIGYIGKTDVYKLYRESRKKTLKREYESSWQQEWIDAAGDKDKERDIQKRARETMERNNLREKWKEEADKWVKDRYKYVIPNLNLTEGQRNVIDKINEIIMNILSKDNKRDARGSPESKIRRVMLGMDKSADPLVWSSKIEKANPEDILKKKIIRKPGSLSKPFIPSQKKSLLSEIKTTVEKKTGGRKKTKKKFKKRLKRRKKKKKTKRKKRGGNIIPMITSPEQFKQYLEDPAHEHYRYKLLKRNRDTNKWWAGYPSIKRCDYSIDEWDEDETYVNVIWEYVWIFDKWITRRNLSDSIKFKRWDQNNREWMQRTLRWKDLFEPVPDERNRSLNGIIIYVAAPSLSGKYNIGRIKFEDPQKRMLWKVEEEPINMLPIHLPENFGRPHDQDDSEEEDDDNKYILIENDIEFREFLARNNTNGDIWKDDDTLYVIDIPDLINNVVVKYINNLRKTNIFEFKTIHDLDNVKIYTVEWDATNKYLKTVSIQNINNGKKLKYSNVDEFKMKYLCWNNKFINIKFPTEPTNINDNNNNNEDTYNPPSPIPFNLGQFGQGKKRLRRNRKTCRKKVTKRKKKYKTIRGRKK